MISHLDNVNKKSNFADTNGQMPTDTEDYLQWRENKLAAYPLSIDALTVTISSITQLTEGEKLQIANNCYKYNFCLYQLTCKEVDEQKLLNFAKNFGLYRLNHHLHAENNGISTLTVSTDGPKEEFIPYTDKKLGWHTDGYYNQPSERINTFLLHCQTPAFEGGASAFCDPDIVYILLKDKNPDYIKALMAEDCMTIPAYEDGQGTKREASIGPVFVFNKNTSKLQMRYTARKHNISWKDDRLTRAAVDYLIEILKRDGFPIIRHRLEAGQGVLCNNVLHNRTGFIDDSKNKRLFYRARYLDSIT
jgi:hypothetical protein